MNSFQGKMTQSDCEKLLQNLRLNSSIKSNEELNKLSLNLKNVSLNNTAVVLNEINKEEIVKLT